RPQTRSKRNQIGFTVHLYRSLRLAIDRSDSSAAGSPVNLASRLTWIRFSTTWSGAGWALPFSSVVIRCFPPTSRTVTEQVNSLVAIKAPQVSQCDGRLPDGLLSARRPVDVRVCCGDANARVPYPGDANVHIETNSVKGVQSGTNCGLPVFNST